MLTRVICAGGLDKLLEIVPLSDEEWQQEMTRKQQISRMRVCDIPRDALVDSSKDADNDSGDEDADSPGKRHFKTRPVDVAGSLGVFICCLCTLIEATGTDSC